MSGVGGLPSVGGSDLLAGLLFFVLAAAIFVPYCVVFLRWLLRLIGDVRRLMQANK